VDDGEVSRKNYAKPESGPSGGRPKSIPARRVGDLSMEELEQIELNANVIRMNLTPEEEVRIIVAVAKAEEVNVKNTFTSDKGGRPSKGNEKAAKKLGIDEGTVRKAKKHVKAIDQLPSLAGSPAPFVLRIKQSFCFILLVLRHCHNDPVLLRRHTWPPKTGARGSRVSPLLRSQVAE